MSRSLRIFFVCTVAILLALGGCSRKEDSATAGGISPTAPASELLERLPVTTLGFIFSDTTSKAYSAYKRSPWYQPADKYLEKLSSIEGEIPGIAALLNVVKKSPLFLSGSGKEGFEGVLFVSGDGSVPGSHVGFWGKTGSPIDPAAFLLTMESALKESGATPKREKIGEVEALTVAMNLEGADSSNLHIVALPDRYGMVSSRALAERLLKPLESIAESDRGIRALKNRASFQRAEARSAQVAGQFVFGFLDVSALEDLVRDLTPSDTSTPPGKAEESLPFETVAFCRSMSEGLHDYVWLGTKPGGIPQDALSALASAGEHRGMKNAPVNAVGALRVDGAVLRAAKSGALSAMSPEEQRQIATASAPLEGVKGITLVVRNASGASPFPEITVMAETSEPAALQGTLKGLLGGLVASGGLPVSGWQTREVAGAKVDFMVSPIGVGLFMGTVNGNLVISSADGAFADLREGRTAPEVERFVGSDRFKGDSRPLALFYLSGKRLVSLLESVQASLAMFTGGKSMVAPEDLEALRTLGEIGTAVSFGEDAFKVHTTYIAEASE
jgi:hypothetical protein